jgi:hypothetical protein
LANLVGKFPGEAAKNPLASPGDFLFLPSRAFFGFSHKKNQGFAFLVPGHVLAEVEERWRRTIS